MNDGPTGEAAPGSLAAIVGSSGCEAGPDWVPATSPEHGIGADRLVALLGATLARLHATEPVGPSAHGLRVLTPSDVVVGARRAVGAGLVTAADLSPAYRHMAVDRLLEVLEQGAARIPAASPSVVTHGRASLDSLRIDPCGAAGFVDWSHVALGDAHRDLAVAARSVAERVGAGAVPSLFDSYGAERIDPLRLDWYSLVAELTPVAGPPRAVDPGSRGSSEP